MSHPRVSVAIALHNEEAVFPELRRRVALVLDGLPGGPHELVLVDDGSTDATFARISEAAASDERVVGVRLSRNFGHQAALTAALETATGDVVVVMDGDLQDRPEEIPRFLSEYDRGYDVVYARRVKRKESLPLRAAYFLFYRLLRRLSEVDVPVDSGDFALLSRRVVDQLNALPERHRYLRGLRTWVGFQQTGVLVERDARAGGEPSYTLRKLLRLAFDGIFAFSVTPLRAAWLLGACVSALASLYAAWAVFERLFLGESPRGFTALIVAITFFAGVQLLFLGLIGEYLGRVYDEAKGRPHFVIADVVRASPTSASAEPAGEDLAFRR
ncbi:MAG TPA: glycosyltransferase family 2 protein [Gaiellaceae bacterium]|nr:glycosyltransferase family 2 protein [Gaiellaceae bacterium]